MLATAVVEFGGKNGAVARVRALCDNGAQVNLIEKRVVDEFALAMVPKRHGVVGV